MKQGDRVLYKPTGKAGTIEVLYAPGMAKCSVVRFDGQQEGYYTDRTQLQLIEERNTA